MRLQMRHQSGRREGVPHSVDRAVRGDATLQLERGEKLRDANASAVLHGRRPSCTVCRLHHYYGLSGRHRSGGEPSPSRRQVTGISEVASELSAKRLALLKEAVPSIKSVAVLWNADDFGMTLRYEAAGS